MFESRIRLALRYSDCSIVVAEIQRTNAVQPTSALSPMQWFYGRRQGVREASAHQIAWTRESQAENLLDWWPSPPLGVRFSNARSKLIALDGIGFMLTQAEIRHRYEPSTMTALGVTAFCDADSPAFFLGVTWHEDDCSPPAQTDSDPSLVYSRATGRFHGETMRAPLGLVHPLIPYATLVELLGDTHHTHRATLRGYAHNEYYSCLLSPSSARDIAARVADLFEYDVGVECSYSTYIW